ncbi:hypothetical protein [Zavarzinia sp.]|uniref:hypothetical protein n=1 Tax=Zavarzinia sp. TaxID=2027920 RepID=UPI003BB71C89
MTGADPNTIPDSALDRAAAAAKAEFTKAWSPEVPDDLWHRVARATVDAIREPTQDMINAGWIDDDDVGPRDIWRAMIRTALNEA